MRIDILTAFPEILQNPLNESILKQAVIRVNLAIDIIDIRDFAFNKHRTIDDAPYGGGPGMILKPEPLFRALESIVDKQKYQLLMQNKQQKKLRIVFPSPQGKLFNQKIAYDLSTCEQLVFLCGHYKAIDQRVVDYWSTDELSVGDFVVSGGEIPSLLMIDSIVRLIPGVLNDIESATTDSFQDGLLDCPYYTRPEDFQGMKVPEVLLSGNHQKIKEWRLNQKFKRTQQKRPDLYEKHSQEKT